MFQISRLGAGRSLGSGAHHLGNGQVVAVFHEDFTDPLVLDVDDVRRPAGRRLIYTCVGPIRLVLELRALSGGAFSLVRVEAGNLFEIALRHLRLAHLALSVALRFSVDLAGVHEVLLQVGVEDVVQVIVVLEDFVRFLVLFLELAAVQPSLDNFDHVFDVEANRVNYFDDVLDQLGLDDVFVEA